MTTVTDESLIAGIISTWRRFGVFDFILPFLLVFGIIYGILERTELFGKEKGKSVNAIIAFTIAMITTLTGWFISFLTGFLPWVSSISIVIIVVLMLLALLYGDFGELLKDTKFRASLVKYGGITVIAVLAIILIYFAQPALEAVGLTNVGNLLSNMGLTVTDLWGIIFFIGFIITLVVIGKGDNKGSAGSV